MNKELRKKLAIDSYLELIEEDNNLNMAYTSLSQYMNILEYQLEEKDKIIDELRNYFNNFDVKSLEEQGLGVEAKEFIIIPLEILERGKNENSNN